MKKPFGYIVLTLVTVALTAIGCGSPPNANNGSSANGTRGANASPTPALVCNDTTITESLAKTYAQAPYNRDAGYFNYFSKGCEVTLYGGVSGESVRSQAINAAKKTDGVTAVHDAKFYPDTTKTSRPIPGSCACPNGYKACGDICIPEGDQCNLKGDGCDKTLATPKP